MRVYMGRYHPKILLKAMPAHLGSDQGENDRFKTFCELVIKGCKEKGVKNFKIDWEQAESLSHVSEDNVIWEEPADLFIPLADYIASYGDPASNGHGHRRGKNRKGQDCMIVPESNIENRKKQRVEKSVLSRTVDDGKHKIGDNHMQDKFGDLTGVIRASCGASSNSSGTSLAALMAQQGGGGSLLSMMASASASSSSSASGGPSNTVSPGKTKKDDKAQGDQDDDLADDMAAIGGSISIPGFQQQAVMQPPAPAPKAKAKGKAKAAADPKPVKRTGAPGVADPNIKRGRGRPKADPSVQTRIEIETFQAIGAETGGAAYRKYLGDEHKTKERQLKSILTALGAMIDATEEVEAYDILIADKKKLEAIITICASFCKFDGTEDGQSFNREFDEAHCKASAGHAPNLLA
jgi:hypothetical protein